MDHAAKDEIIGSNFFGVAQTYYAKYFAVKAS